jgi:hypothetical protein
MTIERTDKCSDRFLAASYQAGSKLNSKLGAGAMSNDIVERSINTRSLAIRFLQIVMTLSGTARTLFISMAAFLSLLCASAFVEQASSESSPSQHSESPPACPTNSARGAGLVEMMIRFSVESPRQNVICIYADGSRTAFEVDRGCDIQPTDINADAIGASNGGFVSGFHECHESEAGGGRCHVICRH